MASPQIGSFAKRELPFGARFSEARSEKVMWHFGGFHLAESPYLWSFLDYFRK
jgi:hypothetical protein